MNSLREAVQEYLSMRRGLGFQLREAGKALPDFVCFLEKRNARHSAPGNWRLLGHNNHRTFNQRNGLGGSVSSAVLHGIAARLIRAQRFHHRDCCLSSRSGHDLISIPMTRSAGYCELPSTCHIVSSVENYGPGFSIACSGY